MRVPIKILIFHGKEIIFVSIYITLTFVGGRDSSIDIATRYGLDDPGIESWWEARFSATVKIGPGAHPASCTMGTGSFLGVKRPGSGVKPHTTIFSAEVVNWVELYLYLP